MLLGNRLCGRHIPPQFKSSETKLKIRFRTDNNIQGDGFKVSLNLYYIIYKIRLTITQMSCYLGQVE